LYNKERQLNHVLGGSHSDLSPFTIYIITDFKPIEMKQFPSHTAECISVFSKLSHQFVFWRTLYIER